MKIYGPSIGLFGWWHLILFFHAIFSLEATLIFDLSWEYPLVAGVVFASSCVAYVGMVMFMAIILFGVSSTVDSAMKLHKK